MQSPQSNEVIRRVREIEEPAMPVHTHICASVHSWNAVVHCTCLVKRKTLTEAMNLEINPSHGSGSCIVEFRPETPL